uniref:Uncharacterized protein n=1 Tax=Avena sativa TaxID=4498 RepID=A0ACD5VHZ7_AVESA
MQYYYRMLCSWYFIIIDDLWATSVWDVATRAFPEGTHGSRIITTTEIEDVALACCSYQSRYIFKMEPLSDGHSKELFISIVFGSGKEKYRQIDEVSDEIIRRCEGLPQAIVSISSVLASQGETNTAENWEQIRNSLPTNTTSEEKLKQILNFCYMCLPSCMQTCLLYLSFYPENYILLKEDIMKQWVAEGFICAPTTKAKMEVAGSYFDKLVNMGLIQHIDVDYSSEVLYYAVHHIVHDIITSKSIEENFITVLDYSKRTTRFSNKVSRLSLQFGSATYATTLPSTGLSQVRSLSFIGLMSCFNLGVICELLLLRYLQVTCNDTVHLPYQMQGLKHLETFETNARIAAIPSDIFHLRSLLHLRLGGGSELPDVTGIVKNDTLNPPPSASGRAISLDDWSCPPDSLQTIKLLPPLCRMPKWIGQLSNLCILKIVVRELEMNDISNLQGLPALTVLSLYVQRRSSTKPISFVTGSFAALEYFEFKCGVLCLAFEEGAMPTLQRIKLGFNAHRGEQYGCSFVGIEDMLSVQKISVLIGSAVGAEERDMKAAEFAIWKSLGRHHSNISIERAAMFEEEFDLPEKHHSIRRKQTSTSSEQPESGKQQVQENVKQKADTSSQLIKRKSNKKEQASVEQRNDPGSLRWKKIVLKMEDMRCKAGILHTISKFAGVKSIAVDRDRETVTVVGYVDVVGLVKVLRKARFKAQLVSVVEIKPDPPMKPKEQKKPKQDPPPMKPEERGKPGTYLPPPPHP